jgi:hypothetical protein
MTAHNPYEDSARARKVIALMGVVPQTRTQAQNDMVALFLESLSQAQRDVYGVLAGCKTPPSETTWEMVVATVRARHVPGDGDSLDVRSEVKRPDFSETVRKAHRAHYQRSEGQRCVACDVLTDVLNQTFDAGVTAAVRAVGL